jgi:hypothetical protein
MTIVDNSLVLKLRVSYLELEMAPTLLITEEDLLSSRYGVCMLIQEKVIMIVEWAVYGMHLMLSYFYSLA